MAKKKGVTGRIRARSEYSASLLGDSRSGGFVVLLLQGGPVILFCHGNYPEQAAILQRLAAHDFRIVAFAMYENYVGVRKGNCAALLAPQVSGGFSIYGHPTYLVAGNLSAKILQGDGHYFIAKKDRVEATSERIAELEAFSAELAEALLPRV